MAIQGMKVEEVDALAVSLREIARQRGIGLNDAQALALTVGMMGAASRSDAFRALLDLLSAGALVESGQRMVDEGLRLVAQGEAENAA